MKHLSVSNLVGFLYYFDRRMPPDYILRDGRILHWKLGFDNERMFTRYIKFEDELYEISGIPDKLDLKRGEVHELKTGKKLTERTKNYALDQVKIYSWLTGLWTFRVFFFYTGSRKLDEIASGETNNEEVEALIYDCLKRRREMQRLLKV